MKRAFKIVLVLLFLSGVAIALQRMEISPTRSQTVSSTISDQAQWQSGTANNIDTTSSSGSVKIDNKAVVQGTEIDITGATGSINGPMTGSASNLIGGHCSGGWSWPISPPIILGEGTWTVDLGQTRSGLIHLQEYGWGWQAGEILFQVSSDGSNWSSVSWSSMAQVCGYGWDDTFISTETSFRYFRMYMNFVDPSDDVRLDIFGFELYNPSQATATHTTGATQIDGGDNFFEWESFTPTQTVPANTTVTYRYRTSPDGSTWSSWVSDIASVTSRSGDTKYRYLQVEATLTNTDGTSTPTIDSYTIGYHTNLAPSTPTAMTAVVGG